MPDAAIASPPELDVVEARLRQGLDWLELPAKPCPPPHHHQGRPVTDVAIIGCGMCGLAALGAVKNGAGSMAFGALLRDDRARWTAVAAPISIRLF